MLKKVGKRSKAANKSKSHPQNRHPKYSDMIIEAIGTVKEQGGCSAQKIMKFINANYQVSDGYELYVRLALKRMIQDGTLQQVKTRRKQASGLYKIAEKGKKSSSKEISSKRKSKRL